MNYARVVLAPSKTAASTLLHTSEILLIAFGILLTLGLIGEYQKSERWKKRLHLFELMVIIGVAGELVADGGIFAFSERLQTLSNIEVAQLNKDAERERLERVGLEQRLADRHVTVQQRQAMLAILKSEKGARIAVQPLMTEGRDVLPYSRELAAVFHDAKENHWDAEEPTGILVTMDTRLDGFMIEIQHDSAAKRKTAETLEKALRVLDSRVIQKPIPPNPNAPQDLIILVGGK